MLLCDSNGGFVYPFSRLLLMGKCFSFSLISWIRRHSKFCEVTILCSVKWIFYVMRSEYSVPLIFYLLCMQSLIYIILCRCAQAKWFLNELQPRVGPFSSINFDELLSFINCTCFSVPISSITFAFHICLSMLLESISKVLEGLFFIEGS